jgi:dynein heavy chain
MLNEAMDSMANIDRADIDVIKSFDHPPEIIKLVMKAICMILDKKPTLHKHSNGEFKESYWRTAIGVTVLGAPDIRDTLVSFDRNKITIEKMAEIEDILAEPGYTYENAQKASNSIVGLYKWVKAIRDYYYIF